MGASKTTVRDLAPSLPGVPAREIDVLRLIGVMPWGPLSEPTVSYDYDEWRRVFGGHMANYFTSVIEQQLFAGGGRKIVSVRTTRYASGASQVSATKASSMAAGGSAQRWYS